MKIRVILADDHSVVRAGIKSVIEELKSGIKVVGEAADGRELLTIAGTTPADVYVVDIEMPVLSGIEAIERLLKARPGSRSVVLSMYREKVLVERAFRAGARGYVLKESVAEDIARAVEEVHAGRYWVSPQISGYLVESFVARSAETAVQAPDSVLTGRQREILKLVCDGLTEKEIAAKLGLSYNTVHVHKNNVMRILGLHSKADLIRYALKHGIVQ
jgi:two-component system, NarL family, response regulator NreC